jgi:hypothetical protein
MTTVKFPNDERYFVIPTNLITSESYLTALINFTNSNIVTLSCTYEEFEPIYQTLTNQINLDKYCETFIDRNYYGANLPNYDNLLKFCIGKLSNFLSTPKSILMANDLDEYTCYKKNMPEHIVPFQMITIEENFTRPSFKKINFQNKLKINHDTDFFWASFYDGIPFSARGNNKISKRIFKVLTARIDSHLSQSTINIIEEIVNSYKISGDEITLCKSLMEIYRGVKHDEIKLKCLGEESYCRIRYIDQSQAWFKHVEMFPVLHPENIKKASEIYYDSDINMEHCIHEVNIIKYPNCKHCQQCGIKQNVKLYLGFINIYPL